MGTQYYKQAITVDTSGGGTSTEFSVVDLLYGRLLIPDGANTAFTFYESDRVGGTFHLCDDVGTNGVLTVPSAASAPKSVALPTVLIGSRVLKIVAGTAKVTVTLLGKSN